MKKDRSEGGQSLIEMSLVLVALAIFVGTALGVTYFGWTKLWLRHVLYESLICRMQNESERNCREKAVYLLESFLPYGSLQEFEIKTLGWSKIRGWAVWRISAQTWVGESTTLTRDGGFASFSFLLPLGLTIFVGLSLLSLFLTERSRQYQHCRHQLLLSQEKIEEGIRSLLALNPKILFLQREREKLEAMRASAHPAAVAAITALIAANEVQQNLMVLQQTNLKQEALLAASQELSELPSGANIQSFSVSKPKLILKPQLTRHRAKTQERPPGFDSLHRVSARWTRQFKELKNIFILPADFANTIQVACAATIRKEGPNWQAQLAL